MLEVFNLQLGLHPLFRRLQGLSDNQVFNKGREVAGDLRERWETSDSSVVQRIQASAPFLRAKRQGKDIGEAPSKMEFDPGLCVCQCDTRTRVSFSPAHNQSIL